MAHPPGLCCIGEKATADPHSTSIAITICAQGELSTAAVRIGGPHTAVEGLYVGVFETHDFRLSASANGVDVPMELVYRNTDLSEYRATLPAAAMNWKVMQVGLRADRSPLLFGYVEVR